MITIAFPYICLGEWRGGYHYLLNLFDALSSLGGEKNRIILFAGHDVEKEALEPFDKISNVQVVRSDLFNKGWKSRLLVYALVFGRHPKYEALMKQHGVQIVFENACFFGWRTSVSTLAWMPDFQHHYLPKMFSWFARLKREFGFRLQILFKRRILLSSMDAKKNFEALYKWHKCEVNVAPFAVKMDVFESVNTVEEIRSKYQLPDNFYFMPNQLWPHKNHILVLEALQILKNQNIDVCVVVSGSSENTGFIQQLEAYAKRASLENNFVMLGSIPYQDLMMLMRGAIALLNPSLFEGWSTTVEEAKALGAPMLLSDLAVHQEQAGDRARYFDRYSAESLAESLLSFAALSDKEMNPKQACADAKLRRHDYATRISDIFCDMVDKH